MRCCYTPIIPPSPFGPPPPRPRRQVDAVGGAVEVSVASEDVSTFLMFAPEEEYLGAKVTGFVPREDGGLSALEMHGQVWCRGLNLCVGAALSDSPYFMDLPFTVELRFYGGDALLMCAAKAVQPTSWHHPVASRL